MLQMTITPAPSLYRLIALLILPPQAPQRANPRRRKPRQQPTKGAARRWHTQSVLEEEKRRGGKDGIVALNATCLRAQL